MSKTIVESMINTVLVNPKTPAFRKFKGAWAQGNMFRSQKMMDETIRAAFQSSDTKAINGFFRLANRAFEWDQCENFKYKHNLHHLEVSELKDRFFKAHPECGGMAGFIDSLEDLPTIYRMGQEIVQTLIEDNPPVPVEIFRHHVPCQFIMELPESCQVTISNNGKELNIRSFLFQLLEMEEKIQAMCIFYCHKPGNEQVEHVGVTWLNFHRTSTSGGDQYWHEHADLDEFSKASGAERLHRIVGLCAAYILSGQPDMREYRPPVMPENASRRARDKWQNENRDRDPIPAVLVGYDWRKPRLYSVDESYRRAFWRWQPHGPGNKLRKWTFVKETTVKYNRNEVLPG